MYMIEGSLLSMYNVFSQLQVNGEQQMDSRAW